MLKTHDGKKSGTLIDWGGQQNVVEKLGGYNVAEIFKIDWTTEVILLLLLPKVQEVYLDDSQLCLIYF